MNKFFYLIFTFLFFFSLKLYSRPPINIFRPSDRPLMPEVFPGTCYQFTVGYEGSFQSRGFQDDFEECNQVFSQCPKPDIRVNVLQIYQDKQNLVADFKGFDSLCPLGQISQRFNLDEENGHFFIPSGCFKVPLNLLFSSRYYFNYGFCLEFHLPVLSMELNNVKWIRDCECFFDDPLEFNLVNLLKKEACLDICGWKRTGIGDLVIQTRWMYNFPQFKPILRNVRTQARFGLNIPTGLKQDEDKILAIPFGNDGSWGIQFAGGLDLFFAPRVQAGLDVQFLYLFGNTKCRRVKTDCNQTDLLFLTKVPAFREFGLGQQYNLYIEGFWRRFSAKIDYQYLKRNDDKLFLCDDKIDPFIANSAESLQEWTTHSFILSLRFDGYNPNSTRFVPSSMGWLKVGFNGKRAILLDTLGLSFTLSF